MKVIVFDIDGTLTATNRVDGHYFRAAVRAVLPVPQGEPLSGFSEHTDSAIFAELHTSYPTPDFDRAEAEVQRHFFEGLEAAVDSEPDAFLPVPGAETVFDAVGQAGWLPAMATGGWRRSAVTKLEAARIPFDGVPLASSSEHSLRVDIILHAARLAGNGTETSELVYVGDGPWDVRACRELGIGFIGREESTSAPSLREIGATATVPDFVNTDALLAFLSEPRSLIPEASSAIDRAVREGW